MNHLLDTMTFFFFWMIGTATAIFVKMNDINNMQERLTLRTAALEFLKFEYKSYMISIFIGILFSACHDQVIEFFKNNKLTPDVLIELSGASPFISTAAYAFIFHYFGYKFFFGKLEKKYGKQLQEEKQQLKEKVENLEQQINITNNKN